MPGDWASLFHSLNLSKFHPLWPLNFQKIVALALSKSIRTQLVSICRNFLLSATSVCQWTPNAGFTIIEVLYFHMSNEWSLFLHIATVLSPPPFLCRKRRAWVPTSFWCYATYLHPYFMLWVWCYKTIFIALFISNRSEAEVRPFLSIYKLFFFLWNIWVGGAGNTLHFPTRLFLTSPEIRRLVIGPTKLACPPC
jgi:hypothetical protein